MKTSRGEAQIVDPGTFLTFLQAECGRADYFKRIFTLVFIRAPRTDDRYKRVSAVQKVAEESAKLLRSCDIVATFVKTPSFALLLPEASVSEAGEMLDELRKKIVDRTGQWDAELACYPIDRRVVEAFLQRMQGERPENSQGSSAGNLDLSALLGR